MNAISNTVNNTFSKIGQGCQNSLTAVAYLVNNSEALEKIAKIADRILRVTELLTGSISAAASNFGSQLRDAVTVFETVKVVGVLKQLLVPGADGKYFLTDVKNSLAKRAERVTLAAHCVFKTVRGLSKFGFVKLGVMAKNVIGKLPIFTLVMDSLILASSGFGFFEILNVSVPKASKKVAEANEKINKWEYRQTAIALLKANDEVERDYFEKKYTAKAKTLEAKLQGLEKEVRLNQDKLAKALELQGQAGEVQLSKAAQDKIIADCTDKSKKCELEIGRVKAKIEKNDGRIAKIAARDCRGLAEDLEKADVNFKIKKWEVCKSNAKQEKSKVWFKVANSIGKIAVITLALSLAAANAWALPFTLSLLFLGLAVDSMGISKILVEEFWKPKPIPKLAAA